MTYRWIERSVKDPSAVRRIQTELNRLDESLARSLILRGIDSFEKARYFFRPSIDYQHDPFMMADMDVAAERVVKAIRSRESVLVYGDYDVDGTTSAALVTSFLRSNGVPAEFFVPHRIEHGYGLSRAGIDLAKARDTSLMIVLDCGVTAVAEVDYAKSLGIDVIICDHHTVKDDIPAAVAVLDPKRPDCSYPFDELSGCGIGYKLVCATLDRLGRSTDEAADLLDLVALSIASDIVPLHGENRILMQEGLSRLQSTPRLGIRALAKAAGTDLADCTTRGIVFSLGPRINAAGRLGDAARAVELLLAADDRSAELLASELEETNSRRRMIDRETAEAAVQMVEELYADDLGAGLVLHNSEWHPGVVGIVASRIVERFARPAILLTTVNGVAKGSGRSVPGINIFDAISQCADLLEDFGGHDFAAGLSIRPDRIPALTDRFRKAAEEQATADTFVPAIDYDSRLSLGAIDSRFWAVLRQFAPHGPTNERPVYRADNLRVLGRPRTVGHDGGHIKLVVRQPDGRPMEVIGFGLGDRLAMLEGSRRDGQPLEMLFSIDEHVWKGRKALQLQAKDIRTVEATQAAPSAN
ncbi:MAG: single-stranded-DNA-specific exonuclease RecJ [Rhodothermia bacterium]|nr:single-stranded-DNA-specific exonuclease RecJ [Rhodothermia bacterium]